MLPLLLLALYKALLQVKLELNVLVLEKIKCRSNRKVGQKFFLFIWLYRAQKMSLEH